MICKFCGLNNNDDAAFCSRCGTPLQNNIPSAAPSAPAPEPSAVDDDKKTMRMSKSANEPVSNSGMGKCQCGYPILPGMQVCPKCHTPLNGQGPAPVSGGDESKKTARISRPSEPVGQPEPPVNRRTVPDQEFGLPKQTEQISAPEPTGSSAKKTERFVAPSQTDGNISKKTVSIYQKPQPQPQPEPEVRPRFSLELIRRDEESPRVTDKKDFDALSVVLNRQNTEPDNNSITSHQQAVLSFENGKWYIEDKSSFKTTFIRVTKKTELEDGDIIVLGNREFKFSNR